MSTSDPGESRLGAVVDSGGVTFRLFSPNATGVELCLFEEDDGGLGSNDSREVERVALARIGDGNWEGRVSGVGAGQLYGYRVDGPYRPLEGHRFNPAKLVMDPRAGAVAGSVTWNEALLGAREGPGGSGGRNGEDGIRDQRDSAPFQARSVVSDTTFDWQGDRPPGRPWNETLIYECHVRGMTRLHPTVPEEFRGSYRGLSSVPVIDHLDRLGVTAVELMPVQHFTRERHLQEQGLPNYWGYSPLAWFAPHAGYAHEAGRQITEFKTMVREFHRADIEVILDVVFNHTAEGGAGGPTLSLRGVDNALYYILDPGDRSRYVDFTGCGNTVHAGRLAVAELILDCLRYWVEEMHVDGFRFDLATTLGRENGVFSGRSSLLDAIGADPVLASTKLIAEPWDVGPGGYHLGSFPPGWAGWNDQFRDTVRSFWRGDPGRRADLATRIAGSADILGAKRRGPLGGVNYITCHDGFTLADLVSYERKHNVANLEDNRDGREENLSRNWGAEGLTGSAEILAARDRARRNLVATLALSSGVPMIAHGDELGRSQGGNNNAYCHDNPLTWVNWEPEDRGREFCGFVERVFALRREMGVFGREEFPGGYDLIWLGSDGRTLTGEDWADTDAGVLGVAWLKSAAGVFAAYLNSGEKSTLVTLAELEMVNCWREVLNTAVLAASETGRPIERDFELAAHSMVVFKGTAR